MRFRLRQFLENISRYLGIAQDEIGTLSQQSTKPEKVSSICAVLAETDVINMVSRAIKPSDILRGIHESMAERLIKLLKSIDVKRGVVMMTGGLALDAGLVKALQDMMVQQKMETKVATHADSLYAGAIGAALWGAFRHGKLKERGLLAEGVVGLRINPIVSLLLLLPYSFHHQELNQYALINVVY